MTEPTNDAPQPPPQKRSVLIKILVGLAIAVAGVLIAAALQPDEFRVTRTATVAAAPDRVFSQFNDLHKWEHWSPWAKMDPNAKNTFDGPDAGVGAKFGWSGNNQVGEGRMIIEDSRPNEFLKIKLEFQRPMECSNTAEFAFKPAGDGTQVTWSMYGRNMFMGKVIGLFMNMDKMVGTDFEKGLASMKSLVEQKQ